MKNVLRHISTLIPIFIAIGCEKVAVEAESSVRDNLISMEDVAKLLSSVELGTDRMKEVYDAVSISDKNGYDLEYTMKNIFDAPGTGVGEEKLKSGLRSPGKNYSRPLRDVFRDYYSSTKASPDGSASHGGISAEEYLDYLSSSNMQIYWPEYDSWDGNTMPVITFEPLGEEPVNVGYYLDSSGEVQEIMVDENMASTRPVWVINSNSDALYTSVEIMRRNSPDWMEGGSIVVERNAVKKTAGIRVKALTLDDITMLRHYDSWFRGASEFFIKVGSVEDFRATTEAELQLYNPAVTDMMVVIKRKELEKPHTLNTVLVSEWTDQLENIAFMITEDDGGTRTSWNCTAMVKCNSKSYGIEIKLPYNSRDDIVWRGQLNRKYIEATDRVTSRFGDILLTFCIKNL